MKLNDLFESKNVLLEFNIINIDQSYGRFMWTLDGWLKTELHGWENEFRDWIMTVAKRFLINDSLSVRLYTSKLGTNFPEWAYKAAEEDNLYEFAPTMTRATEISHIMHFFKTLFDDIYVIGHRATPQQKQRKVENERFLKSIMHVSYPDMVRKSQEYFNKKASNEQLKEDFNVVLKFDNNWMWVQLASEEAFKKAGRMLQNCIGSYYTYKNTSNEGEQIYILLDPKHKGHVAARTEGKNLEEIKGKQNTVPAKQYHNYCKDFIRKVAGDSLQGLSYFELESLNRKISYFGLAVYDHKFFEKSELEAKIVKEVVYTEKDTKEPYRLIKLGPQDILDALVPASLYETSDNEGSGDFDFRRAQRYHGHSYYEITDLQGNMKFSLIIDLKENVVQLIKGWTTNTPENLQILNQVLQRLSTRFESEVILRKLGLYYDRPRNLLASPGSILLIVNRNFKETGRSVWELTPNEHNLTNVNRVGDSHRITSGITSESVGILVDKGTLNYEWKGDKLYLSLTHYGQLLVDAYIDNKETRTALSSISITGTNKVRPFVNIFDKKESITEARRTKTDVLQQIAKWDAIIKDPHFNEVEKETARNNKAALEVLLHIPNALSNHPGLGMFGSNAFMAAIGQAAHEHAEREKEWKKNPQAKIDYYRNLLNHYIQRRKALLRNRIGGDEYAAQDLAELNGKIDHILSNHFPEEWEKLEAKRAEQRKRASRKRNEQHKVKVQDRKNRVKKSGLSNVDDLAKEYNDLLKRIYAQSTAVKAKGRLFYWQREIESYSNTIKGNMKKFLALLPALPMGKVREDWQKLDKADQEAFKEVISRINTEGSREDGWTEAQKKKVLDALKPYANPEARERSKFWYEGRNTYYDSKSHWSRKESHENPYKARSKQFDDWKAGWDYASTKHQEKLAKKRK